MLFNKNIAKTQKQIIINIKNVFLKDLINSLLG